jgi:hypothetical protein
MHVHKSHFIQKFAGKIPDDKKSGSDEIKSGTCERLTG